MIMSLCKKGLHSFLGPTHLIDHTNTTNSVAAATASLPLSSSHANMLKGGVGLVTAAAHDVGSSTNILESASVGRSPASRNGSDVSVGMFLDDIGEVVDGLMSCTESLGFESSDERRVDDQIMEDIEKNMSSKSDEEWHVGRARWREESERRRERKFPPPLSSWNHKGRPSFFLRPVRKDGRLELTEVWIDQRETLRASREDGRLRLEFIRGDEEEEEEGEEEAEEQVIDEKEEEEQEEVPELEEHEEQIYGESEVERSHDERLGEWRFPVGGEGFGRCHEQVSPHKHHLHHRSHHHRHHHHHHQLHHDLHVWRQHCVTTG